MLNSNCALYLECRPKRKEPCLLRLFYPAKCWCSSTTEQLGSVRFGGWGGSPCREVRVLLTVGVAMRESPFSGAPCAF